MVDKAKTTVNDPADRHGDKIAGTVDKITDSVDEDRGSASGTTTVDEAVAALCQWRQNTTQTLRRKPPRPPAQSRIRCPKRRTTTEPGVGRLPTTTPLIPDIATGAAGELGALRDAATAAVGDVCSNATSIAVLVPGSADLLDHMVVAWLRYRRRRRRGTDPLCRWPSPDGCSMDAPRTLLGTDLAARRLREYDAVLAMGDGSAARTDKAPLHLDPLAAPLDDAAVAAIRSADLDAFGTRPTRSR